MILKLDENLGHSIAELFQAAGHDVSTVYDQELTSASDEVVYRACLRERRTLVTLDLDFANPMRFDPSAGAGIAVLRVPAFPVREDVHVVARTLVDGLGRSSIAGRLWVVRGSTIRQYEPGEPPDPR